MGNFIQRLFSKSAPDKVAAYYDEWTDRYMQGFGDIFQAKQADTQEALMDYFARQMGLRDGMKILDAGCGVGGPARLLARRFDLHIDAVTISETQAEIARCKVEEEGLQHRVTVHSGDFHDLSAFAPGTYDVVYFMESLVHSPQPAKAIAEAYRLLKADGVLYIKDLYEKTPYSPEEIKDIQHWVAHNNEHLCLHIIPKEELLLMLRRQGMQLEFCQLMRIPTNQDLGNRFVAVNNIMPDPIANSLPPYLEWYEIKALKPGPGLVHKM